MIKKILGILIVTTLVMSLIGCGCGSKDETKLNMDVTVQENDNVLNENNIKISVVEQSFSDGTLTVHVENNSKKELSAAILKSLVNNISLNDTTCNETIKKKEKKDIKVKFNTKELKANNIGEVSSIKMLLVLIDTSEYKEAANTGYFELKTSSDYVQDISSDGSQVFNKKSIEVYFTGKEIKNDNLVFNLQVINNKKKPVFLNIGNTRVNNAEFSAIIYDTMPAKSLSNVRLILSKSMLKEYSVKASDIKYCTVDISAFDTTTYEKTCEAKDIKLK